MTRVDASTIMADLTPDEADCKEVGGRLYELLTSQGVDLRGYGITWAQKSSDPAIRIYAYSDADAKKVPSEFGGYEVRTVVTGDIVAQ
jgi:hypothetical protein